MTLCLTLLLSNLILEETTSILWKQPAYSCWRNFSSTQTPECPSAQLSLTLSKSSCCYIQWSVPVLTLQSPRSIWHHCSVPSPWNNFFTWLVAFPPSQMHVLSLPCRTPLIFLISALESPHSLGPEIFFSVHTHLPGDRIQSHGFKSSLYTDNHQTFISIWPLSSEL